MDLLREHVRMCVESECETCPLWNAHGNIETVKCAHLFLGDYKKAVEIITKWAKEHPRKTYAQDFLEKHPNAMTSVCDGVPVVQWCCIYPVHKGAGCLDRSKTCSQCWNQPMEDNAE